jgi:hypothetical protein
VDTRTISPAGDHFHGAHRHESPHIWMNGVVYIGHMVFDEFEEGDEVERIEAIPCRRCAQEAREDG